jgi:hypothetical protein
VLAPDGPLSAGALLSGAAALLPERMADAARFEVGFIGSGALAGQRVPADSGRLLVHEAGPRASKQVTGVGFDTFERSWWKRGVRGRHPQGHHQPRSLLRTGEAATPPARPWRRWNAVRCDKPHAGEQGRKGGACVSGALSVLRAAAE